MNFPKKMHGVWYVNDWKLLQISSNSLAINMVSDGMVTVELQELATNVYSFVYNDAKYIINLYLIYNAEKVPEMLELTVLVGGGSSRYILNKQNVNMFTRELKYGSTSVMFQACLN